MLATSNNQYRQNCREVWVLILSVPVVIRRKELACSRQGILTKIGD